VRITSVAATPISVPLVKPEAWAYGVRECVDVVIVEVTTDKGVTGIGEAGAYPSAGIVVEVVNSLASMVVDQDPFRIEHLTRLVDVVGTWHHTKFSSPALAAIEMACFDIAGKECGQPVVNLLGGRVRDRVAYVYYVSGASEEELGADATRGAEEGFSVFYLKVTGATVDDDVAAVAAVREGLGARGRIRVDANESWSPAAAVETLHAMEPYGLDFAEQPVSGRNLTEMAYVRSRVNIPLLANEASWTRYDQLEVIRHGAADAISVDNQMDGGLLNAKHGASMCEVAGIPVVKHSLGELGIGAAAATHLIGSTPNFRYAHQHYLGRITDDVTTEATRPRVSGGYVDIPMAPGLGVELDREKLATYAQAYRTRQDGGFSLGDLQETPLLPKR
jgi:L-alanine-DL-glutamate epimerase-like enolase superfamily enzyme